MFELVASLFSHPVVAGIAGGTLGVALLLFSRASFRSVTPENPAGLAVAAVMMFGRMAVSAGALVAVYLFARPGFAAFAAALAAGFIVTYSIELIRYARLTPRVR